MHLDMSAAGLVVGVTLTEAHQELLQPNTFRSTCHLVLQELGVRVSLGSGIRVLGFRVCSGLGALELKASAF